MTTLTALAVALILAISTDTCFAIKCLECSDTPHPGICDTVANCYGNNTSCFIRQYITTSGSVLHETGCKSTQACNAIKRDLATDDAADAYHDIDVCLECCNDMDYCNIEGCGTNIPDVSHRGLYCYECAVENDVYGCRTVRQCDPGYMCSIKKASFPGYYKTGCVPSHECVANDVPSLIGRRSQRRAAVHVPYCCDKDFCNDILRFIVDSNSNVDGAWSTWNSWSGCTETCGNAAVRTRNRKCDNPIPQNNGSVCTGNGTETTSCLQPDCSVDGGWSNWGTWSLCTKTCGDDGLRSRSRSCDSPAPQHNGKICTGKTVETVSCVLPHCPVDGAWSDWGAWGSCSDSCGIHGYTHKFRHCNNPSPQYNGHQCDGASIHTKHCRLVPCPVHGAWSDWSHWGMCTKTCGSDSVQHRLRFCDNPSPLYNGHICHGHSTETKNCTVSPCQVNGAWSTWGQWSSCTRSCGSGATQNRLRSCNNPPPQNNGHACHGNALGTRFCTQISCPVDGGWSNWGSWSTQGYNKTRHRSCNNPTPQHHGATCHGHSRQTMTLADRCKQANGFDFVKADSVGVQMCLRFSSGTYTWQASQDRCKHDGGRLVVIPNYNVDQAVLGYLKSRNAHFHTQGEAQYAWIGLYATHDNWQWAESNEHFSYNRFDGKNGHHHQPNHCVCETGTHEHWWTVHCSSTYYHYICEIDISD